jgi:hypothetical protein
MFRAALVVSILTLLVGGLCAPAAAGVTSATLAASSSTSYSGLCPTTMSFNGTVTGTAGTKFTLAFNRFINGVQQVADKGPFTLPASGTMSISDSISIAASTSGATFDQIWVHGISPAQPDVYSNKVDFTAVCASPPGPLAAPTNFKTTTDPGVCGDHVAPLFGALICGAALKDGDLIVVWDYADPSKVDGFRIFNTTGGAHTQIDTQSGMTGKALKIKAADAKSMCFVVRAYKGAIESTDSNSTCTPAIGLVNYTTVKLPINGYRSVNHYSHEYVNATYCFYTRGLGPSFSPSGQQLLVGFEDFWDAGTNPFPCYEKIDHAYRTAIKFDMGPLAGKKIWSATLSFTNQKTVATIAAPPATCLSQIMYGIGDWSGAQNLISGDPYLDLPTGTNVNVSNAKVHIANSTSFQIDVTDSVRAWLDGSRPNFGFVFRGPRENYARDNDQCGSFYGNVSLAVEYFG